MRVYLLIILVVFVLATIVDVANAKSKTTEKSVKNTYSKETKKGAKKETQEVQEEQPVFEKARIRYTKPKTDSRVKEEVRAIKTKQDAKKIKNLDAKNKYKAPQDQVTKPQKIKKQEKYSINEEITNTKASKDKRLKRDVATKVGKEKLKKVQREEAGVEEHSEEGCPPCDCNTRDQYFSNNAEEDVTTIEIETEEQVQDDEETDENLQCDSLVEGCDV